MSFVPSRDVVLFATFPDGHFKKPLLSHCRPFHNR
jgi:hypothetical protein